MNKAKPSRWYLKLLAPGEPIGWTDPSPLYMNGQAFSDLLDDLTEPFRADQIDLVVAMEPFGYMLGAGIAARLGLGVLVVRKDALLAGPLDSIEYPRTMGRPPGQMTTRKPGFLPGTRILIVDQWVESGGAMSGILELVKRQNGIVAGIATLCIEEKNAHLRSQYKCATAVLPRTNFQDQCNRHQLDHFQGYDWNSIVPSIREGSDKHQR